ncbi:hypothetical protein GGF49_005999, partial [Coemansia sp. RSA 1853]
MAGTSLNSIVRGRAQGLILADTLQHQISRSVFATLALCETKRLARAHTAAILSLSIDTVQHRYMLTAGTDTSIQLFDLESTGQINPTRCVLAGSGHTNTVTSVEWYPVDNGMFSTASLDHTVKIWDAHAMTEASQFDLDTCEVLAVDVCTGEVITRLDAHFASVTCAAWRPSFGELYTGGTDSNVVAWSVREVLGSTQAVLRTDTWSDSEPDDN